MLIQDLSFFVISFWEFCIVARINNRKESIKFYATDISRQPQMTNMVSLDNRQIFDFLY
jgi:hypothetical protein